MLGKLYVGERRMCFGGFEGNGVFCRCVFVGPGGVQGGGPWASLFRAVGPLKQAEWVCV